MAKDKTLEDLFYDTLQDIYFAERQILKALPKMARAAQSSELKAGFEKHREETEGQVERLQQIFELIGKRAKGKTCEAIQGIIAEGEEIIEEFKGTPALDAGLISSAQAVEHYEMARYGTLKTWAADARPQGGRQPARPDAAAGNQYRQDLDEAGDDRRQSEGCGLNCNTRKAAGPSGRFLTASSGVFEEIDEGPKCRPHLSTARIVDVEARNRAGTSPQARGSAVPSASSCSTRMSKR